MLDEEGGDGSEGGKPGDRGEFRVELRRMLDGSEGRQVEALKDTGNDRLTLEEELRTGL